jgi:TRAP-type C4-dicarboxylate transport system permease small subunit
MPNALRRTLDGLFNAAAAVAACCVLAIFVLMIVGGVGRQLNFKVSGINDIVAWLCAAAAFFAMAHSFKHGDFVRVTLVLEKLSSTARRWVDVVCLSIAAVAVTYLTYSATAFTYESYEFAEMATGLVVIPIWIPQATFVIGCWLLLLAVLDELWIVLRGGKPSYQIAVEERHAKGDFSADV